MPPTCTPSDKHHRHFKHTKFCQNPRGGPYNSSVIVHVMTHKLIQQDSLQAADQCCRPKKNCITLISKFYKIQDGSQEMAAVIS